MELRASTQELKNITDFPLPTKPFARDDTEGDRVHHRASLLIDQSPAVSYSFETLDRVVRAMTARFTQGVSPHAQMAALLDWTTHLSRAPGRQIELMLKASTSSATFAHFAVHSLVSDAADRPFKPTPSDKRFADAAWKSFPFPALIWFAVGITSSTTPLAPQCRLLPSATEFGSART